MLRIVRDAMKRSAGSMLTTTLSQYVSGALDDLSSHEFSLAEALANNANTSDSVAASDSLEIKSLVERLLKPSELALHPTHCVHHSSRRQRPTPAEAELLADRAAEILRYVEPTEDDDTLGTLGDYLLVKLIGAGSTGVVFHAIEQSLDRSVALKVLRPSLGSIARERFVAEARVAASIEHPNVVTIYQVGQQDRLAYIAMQWLPGETLDEMLTSGPDLDEAEIRRIATQVAAGLSAAHHQQLVHRDIKPANLWVCEGTGEIKILDFGLARIADDDPGLTATGMLAGTPNFMSPEQARGLELDGRSDLFSLGCVLYRLLTGRLPFGSPTVLATLQSIQSDQPTPPKSIRTDISESLSDLTMSLLEKQPPNRPGTADELIDMLEHERNDWPTSVIRYQEYSQRREAKHEFVDQQALIRSPLRDSSPSKESKVVVSHTTLDPKRKPLPTDFYFWRWIAATVLGLLGLGAVWYSPQIIRIASDEGEIVIETDDDSVQVTLTDGDLVQVLDTKTKKSFNIRSGQYEITARDTDETGTGEVNSFEITPRTLSMSRGGQRIVKVTRLEKTDDPMKLALKNSQSLEGSPNADVVLVANDEQTAISADKIFNGHNLDHWLDVAERDFDPATAAAALDSASKLATNKTEQKRLFDSIRSLMRRSRTLPAEGANDSTHAQLMYANARVQSEPELFVAINKAFSNVEPEQIVAFIRQEIESGNRSSRSYCQHFVSGTLFSTNIAKQKQLWNLLITEAIPLLESMDELAQQDVPATALLYVFSGNLSAHQYDAARQIFVDIRPEIEKLNPELRPWVARKFAGLVSSESPSRDAYWTMLKSLSGIKGSDVSKNFFEEMFQEFFDPATSPSRREEIYQTIPYFEVDEQSRAEFLLLVLRDQLAHRGTVPIFKPNFAKDPLFAGTKPRLAFDKLETLEFDHEGVIGGQGNPTRITNQLANNTEPKEPEFATGAPAVLRNVVTSLWLIESSLPQEFKQKTLAPFIAKLIKENDNGQTDRLKIFVDLRALVVRAGNTRTPRSQKRGKGGLDEEPPLKLAPSLHK